MANSDWKAMAAQQLNLLDPEAEHGEYPSSSADIPRRYAPPLPPRGSTHNTAPPPYSPLDQKASAKASEQWHSHDPRSSSTQSLVPSESARDGRRTLLLIYIHGFMGNETSFQSFPAHVHNLLTITVADTHVVHTKLYPRYKSRRAIEFARDDFSDWLEPHEGHMIDVVLLGHSMGGLLAAEVALMAPNPPTTGQPFRHRILGTISFDTPFLGMHPGLVSSGIASLFRTAPVSPPATYSAQSESGVGSSSSQLSITPSNESSSAGLPTRPTSLSPTQSQASSIYTLPSNDPYYDPPFPNDIHRPERTGWNKLFHFVSKHSDGFSSLASATKQYFMSHMEFGGCLADFQGLKIRYARIRALEDVDELADHGVPGHNTPLRRVRFLNYYTASTGIPKKPKTPPSHEIDKEGNLEPVEKEMQEVSLTSSSSRSVTPIPRISIEQADGVGGGAAAVLNIDGPSEPSPIQAQMQDLGMQNLGENSGVQLEDEDEPPAMRHIDSMPIEDDDELVVSHNPVTEEQEDDNAPVPELKRQPSEPPLPPIPGMPEEPQVIDLSLYTDKDERKIAEKEQKRLLKVYQQAVKDRENAIKDRKKLIEKREKKARQEQEKQLKAEEKQRLKEEKEALKEEEKRKATINPPPVEATNPTPAKAGETPEKPKKDRKFCLLPPDINGHRDKCWVRVYMEGVDEVGAHCGLFFPGPQYESLVADVGQRVEEWVKDDATRRAILGMDAD